MKFPIEAWVCLDNETLEPIGVHQSPYGPSPVIAESVADIQMWLSRGEAQRFSDSKNKHYRRTHVVKARFDFTVEQ
jgi:hypothetical protein